MEVEFTQERISDSGEAQQRINDSWEVQTNRDTSNDLGESQSSPA